MLIEVSIPNKVKCMVIRDLIFLIISFALLGCNSDSKIYCYEVRKSNEKVLCKITTECKTGKVIDSTHFLINSEIKHGVSYELIDGKHYYQSYKNDSLYGAEKCIYQNGRTFFKGLNLKGCKVGEWNYFDSLGTRIRMDYFINNKLVYRRRFKENSFSIEGKPLWVSYGDSVINDKVDVFICMAIPKDSKVELFIGTGDENNEPFERESGGLSLKMYEFPQKEDMYFTEHRYLISLPEGERNVLVYMGLIDKVSGQPELYKDNHKF
tara:strand:- start:21360 stop:22157 length:798 start_codon:yes stop_codon:yes gene_type:complete